MFEISHYNFETISSGDWQKTIYKIYDNKKIDIINEYVNKNKIKKISIIIQEDYDRLNELMNKAVHITEKVKAYDGDAWSFIYYKNDKIYWQRKVDYIYGIKVFEDITKILLKYQRSNYEWVY